MARPRRSRTQVATDPARNSERPARRLPETVSQNQDGKHARVFAGNYTLNFTKSGSDAKYSIICNRCYLRRKGNKQHPDCFWNFGGGGRIPYCAERASWAAIKSLTKSNVLS